MDMWGIWKPIIYVVLLPETREQPASYLLATLVDSFAR